MKNFQHVLLVLQSNDLDTPEHINRSKQSKEFEDLHHGRLHLAAS